MIGGVELHGWFGGENLHFTAALGVEQYGCLG